MGDTCVMWGDLIFYWDVRDLRKSHYTSQASGLTFIIQWKWHQIFMTLFSYVTHNVLSTISHYTSQASGLTTDLSCHDISVKGSKWEILTQLEFEIYIKSTLTKKCIYLALFFYRFVFIMTYISFVSKVLFVQSRSNYGHLFLTKYLGMLIINHL